MVSIRELLSRLTDHQVEFVVVGGMAAVLHGSAVVTQDLDICAPMTPENFAQVISALRGLDPRNRMTPQRLALPGDPDALKGFKNLSLITDAGVLAILGEIKGIGDYDAASAHAIIMGTFDFPVRVLDLDTLILAKAAMGRHKDHRVIADLETIRQRLQQPPSS